MKRRLEYIGGGSRKFWEVWQEGSEHVVRFGRIGTDGQERRKDHGTASAAARAIRKLIDSKRAKGYWNVDVEPGPVVEPAPAAPAPARKDPPRRPEPTRKKAATKAPEPEPMIRPRQVRRRKNDA